MRKSQTLLLVLMVLAISTPVGAQGRSPLLDKVVRSVNKHEPLWHFIPANCTCPALVSSQISYAMGSWYLGDIRSRRRVTMYISYTSSVQDATQWMEGMNQGDVVKGWRRATYKLADASYLWNADAGYSYLYVRQGSVVVELSGDIADVKRFAKYAEKQMPASEHAFGADSP